MSKVLGRSIKEIGDQFIQEGNHYPYHMPCPKCGKKYFALFDKLFIDHIGECYWPCGDSRPEIELALENVLALVQEIL